MEWSVNIYNKFIDLFGNVNLKKLESVFVSNAKCWSTIIFWVSLTFSFPLAVKLIKG